MKLSIAQDDGQNVHVAVEGRVTQRELPPLNEPLQELLGPDAYARQVRLDLSNTDYLDSSGVGWLLTCHKRMRQAGGRLTLHSPHPIVANVLHVLKLEKVFHIEPEAGGSKPGSGAGP
jgi:anti-sigma B factor antagonist